MVYNTGKHTSLNEVKCMVACYLFPPQMDSRPAVLQMWASKQKGDRAKQSSSFCKNLSLLLKNQFKT